MRCSKSAASSSTSTRRASPCSGARPSTDELRRRLSERLPAYMMPSAFVLMDQLPLTPNAKVDRAGLCTALLCDRLDRRFTWKLIRFKHTD